jgi:hypothetical protein
MTRLLYNMCNKNHPLYKTAVPSVVPLLVMIHWSLVHQLVMAANLSWQNLSRMNSKALFSAFCVYFYVIDPPSHSAVNYIVMGRGQWETDHVAWPMCALYNVWIVWATAYLMLKVEVTQELIRKFWKSDLPVMVAIKFLCKPSSLKRRQVSSEYSQSLSCLAV